MLTSSIAIPNYKTNIGKTGLDILAKVEGFQEMAKKIQYKDDVMSALESVDLYEVDYAFVTKKIYLLLRIQKFVIFSLIIWDEVKFYIKLILI